MQADTLGNVLMIVAGTLGISVLALLAASLTWVYRDAQAREKTGGLWLLIAFITWPLGVAAYAYLRNKEIEIGELAKEPEITLNDRLWAALSWIPASPLWPVVAILVLLLKSTKKRPFIRYNAALSITMGVIIILLTILIVGLVVMVYFVFLYPDFETTTTTIPSVLLFFLFFYWAFQALRGKTVEIPLVSNWIRQRRWAQ
jgi:uncharacterized membrane protein